jgi:hypothetical protein
MIDTVFQSELLKQMDQLPPDLQQQVLHYAKSLKSSLSRGTPGKEFLKFSGILSPEDAAEMLRIIEEGCEQVDPNEW